MELSAALAAVPLWDESQVAYSDATWVEGRRPSGGDLSVSWAAAATSAGVGAGGLVAGGRTIVWRIVGPELRLSACFCAARGASLPGRRLRFGGGDLLPKAIPLKEGVAVVAADGGVHIVSTDGDVRESFTLGVKAHVGVTAMAGVCIG